MSRSIKKLFSNSVVYGLGNTVGKSIGFLLIPVYTRYLTTEDYGILSLCTMFGTVLFVFLNMGLSSAIFKNYIRAATQKEKNEVVTTTFFLMILISIPISIFLTYQSGWVSDLLLGDSALKNAILLVVFNAFLTLLLTVPFSLMRIKEEAKKYATLTVLRTILTIGLTLILVVGFKKGFWGILISRWIALLLLCIFLVPKVLHNLPLIFSLKEAKGLLSFGVPLVGSGLAGFILTLSDRFFLKHYSTMHQVGLYSLGYKIGEVMWFLVWAVQLAWPQFLFTNEKLHNAKTIYSRTSTYYIGVMGFVCLSFSVLAKEIIKVMATPSFFESYRVIPLITVAQLFYGLFFVGTIGLYLKKKTYYFPITVGIAAAVNLLLNYLWIPEYGMMGAAYATLISYFIQFLLSFAISVRYYSVPYEYIRIIKIIIIGLGIYFAGYLIRFDSVVKAIMFNSFLLCLFPILLFLFNFFVQEELSYIKEFFSAQKDRLKNFRISY